MLTINKTSPVFRTISSTPTLRVILSHPEERVMTEEDVFLRANANLNNVKTSPDNLESETVYKPIFRKFCGRNAHREIDSSEDDEIPGIEDQHYESTEGALLLDSIQKRSTSPPKESNADLKWDFKLKKQKDNAMKVSRQQEAQVTLEPETEYQSPKLIENFRHISAKAQEPACNEQPVIDKAQFELEEQRIDELLEKIETIDRQLERRVPQSENRAEAPRPTEDQKEDMDLYNRMQTEICTENASYSTILEQQKLQLEENNLLMKQIGQLAGHLQQTSEDDRKSPRSQQTEASTQCTIIQTEEPMNGKDGAVEEPIYPETRKKNVLTRLPRTEEVEEKKFIRTIRETGIERLSASPPEIELDDSLNDLKYKPFAYEKIKDPYATSQKREIQKVRSPTRVVERPDYVGDALHNFEQAISSYEGGKHGAAYDEEVEELKRLEVLLKEKIGSIE